MPSLNGFQAHSRTDEKGDVLVFLTGELDLSVAEHLRKELERVEKTNPARMVLDLSGLTFMDSTGLRLILEADQRARLANRALLLVEATNLVQRVFRITGVDGRLKWVKPD